MEQAINGQANGRDQAIPAREAIVRNAVPRPNGTLLIYNTSAGMYLGSIQVECGGPEVLSIITEDFVAFVAAQLNPVKIAPATVLSALKRP